LRWAVLLVAVIKNVREKYSLVPLTHSVHRRKVKVNQAAKEHKMKVEDNHSKHS